MTLTFASSNSCLSRVPDFINESRDGIVSKAAGRQASARQASAQAEPKASWGCSDYY